MHHQSWYPTFITVLQNWNVEFPRKWHTNLFSGSQQSQLHGPLETCFRIAQQLTNPNRFQNALPGKGNPLSHDARGYTHSSWLNNENRTHIAFVLFPTILLISSPCRHSLLAAPEDRIADTVFVRFAGPTRKLHLARAVSCVCTALAEELPADEDHIEHRFPPDNLDYLLRNSNLAGLPCRYHLSRSWSTMHNRINISGTNVMVHTMFPVVRDWFRRHVPNVHFATMALNCSKILRTFILRRTVLESYFVCGARQRQQPFSLCPFGRNKVFEV